MKRKGDVGVDVVAGVLSLFIITILVFVIIGDTTMRHNSRHTYNVIVTDKQVKNGGGDSADVYMVYTEIEDGEVRVFEDIDSPYEHKYNSSDIYAQLKIGHKYEFDVYGWREQRHSQYENIITVKEIQ